MVKNFKSYFVFGSLILAIVLAAVFVMAAAGEGAATIGGGATQDVEISSSTVFTIVLTVGGSGIATDAASPTFTIPTGFTTPHVDGGASVPTNVGEVGVDGEWFAAGSGGSCVITMGSSAASGQVITPDVTGACSTTDLITLTYKGSAPGTAALELPLDIKTASVSGDGAVVSIDPLPNITVYGTTVFADHATGAVALTNNLAGLASVGGTDVVLGGFKITAAGEDVDFTNLRATVTLGAMVIGEFTNLRIVSDNGTGDGAADDGTMHDDELAAAVATVASPTAGDTNDITVSLTVSGTENFFIVGTIAGTVSHSDTLDVEVTGAASTSAGATSSITITSTGTSANAERTITDTIAPTLTITIVPTSPSKTKASLVYTFEFSEDVTGFAIGDITLDFNGTGAAVADSTFATTDANTYTLTLDSGTDATDLAAIADGETIVASVDMTALTDIATNAGVGATADTWTYDTTNPVASASCSPSSVRRGATVTCTCSGTDSSGINSSLTTAGATPSTSSSGTFSYTCSVTDNSGNSHSASASYVVASSSSGGAPTYSASGADLLNGYSVSLGRYFRARFNLEGQSHYLKVDSISGNKITVTISSDPITLDIIVGQTEKVDVDADGDYDLSIYLEAISSNKANLVLTLIDEVVSLEGDAVAPEAVEEDYVDLISGEAIVEVEGAMSSVLLWAVVAVVIVLLIVLGIKLKSKRKRKK